jgi:hypothetical protein
MVAAAPPPKDVSDAVLAATTHDVGERVVGRDQRVWADS